MLLLKALFIKSKHSKDKLMDSGTWNTLNSVYTTYMNSGTHYPDEPFFSFSAISQSLGMLLLLPWKKDSMVNPVKIADETCKVNAMHFVIAVNPG